MSKTVYTPAAPGTTPEDILKIFKVAVQEFTQTRSAPVFYDTPAELTAHANDAGRLQTTGFGEPYRGDIDIFRVTVEKVETTQ